MSRGRVPLRAASVAGPEIGIARLPEQEAAAFCVNFIRRKA
jgi:hypothetical protein